MALFAAYNLRQNLVYSMPKSLKDDPDHFMNVLLYEWAYVMCTEHFSKRR